MIETLKIISKQSALCRQELAAKFPPETSVYNVVRNLVAAKTLGETEAVEAAIKELPPADAYIISWYGCLLAAERLIDLYIAKLSFKNLSWDAIKTSAVKKTVGVFFNYAHYGYAIDLLEKDKQAIEAGEAFRKHFDRACEYFCAICVDQEGSNSLLSMHSIVLKHLLALGKNSEILADLPDLKVVNGSKLLSHLAAKVLKGVEGRAAGALAKPAANSAIDTILLLINQVVLPSIQPPPKPSLTEAAAEKAKSAKAWLNRQFSSSEKEKKKKKEKLPNSPPAEYSNPYIILFHNCLKLLDFLRLSPLKMLGNYNIEKAGFLFRNQRRAFREHLTELVEYDQDAVGVIRAEYERLRGQVRGQIDFFQNLMDRDPNIPSIGAELKEILGQDSGIFSPLQDGLLKLAGAWNSEAAGDQMRVSLDNLKQGIFKFIRQEIQIFSNTDLHAWIENNWSFVCSFSHMFLGMYPPRGGSKKEKKKEDRDSVPSKRQKEWAVNNISKKIAQLFLLKEEPQKEDKKDEEEPDEDQRKVPLEEQLWRIIELASSLKPNFREENLKPIVSIVQSLIKEDLGGFEDEEVISKIIYCALKGIVSEKNRNFIRESLYAFAEKLKILQLKGEKNYQREVYGLYSLKAQIPMYVDSIADLINGPFKQSCLFGLLMPSLQFIMAMRTRVEKLYNDSRTKTKAPLEYGDFNKKEGVAIVRDTVDTLESVLDWGLQQTAVQSASPSLVLPGLLEWSKAFTELYRGHWAYLTLYVGLEEMDKDMGYLWRGPINRQLFYPKGHKSKPEDNVFIHYLEILQDMNEAIAAMKNLEVKPVLNLSKNEMQGFVLSMSNGSGSFFLMTVAIAREHEEKAMDFFDAQEQGNTAILRWLAAHIQRIDNKIILLGNGSALLELGRGRGEEPNDLLTDLRRKLVSALGGLAEKIELERARRAEEPYLLDYDVDNSTNDDSGDKKDPDSSQTPFFVSPRFSSLMDLGMAGAERSYDYHPDFFGAIDTSLPPGSFSLVGSSNYGEMIMFRGTPVFIAPEDSFDVETEEEEVKPTRINSAVRRIFRLKNKEGPEKPSQQLQLGYQAEESRLLSYIPKTPKPLTRPTGTLSRKGSALVIPSPLAVEGGPKGRKGGALSNIPNRERANPSIRLAFFVLLAVFLGAALTTGLAFLLLQYVVPPVLIASIPSILGLTGFMTCLISAALLGGVIGLGLLFLRVHKYVPQDKDRPVLTEQKGYVSARRLAASPHLALLPVRKTPRPPSYPKPKPQSFV